MMLWGPCATFCAFSSLNERSPLRFVKKTFLSWFTAAWIEHPVSNGPRESTPRSFHASCRQFG